jgi:ABC superfamily ATP binding cassette transporter, binding protein
MRKKITEDIMKSKFTGLILAAVLLFGSVGLVGCRPGGSSTVDEYTPNLDVDYEITETLKVGITADAREKELIEGLIEGFNEIFPNVTIQPEVIQGTNYTSALSSYYQADLKNPGTMPDILWMSSAESFPLIEEKLFLNLDPYINAELERDSEFLDAFYPEMWKLGQQNFDGAQYLIPRSADRVVTHINKGIFKAANVDMSKVKNGWTWQDFLDTCETIRKYFDENGMTGQYVIDAYINWEAVMYPIFLSNGCSVFDENNQLVVNSEEGRAALNMMNELVEKRYVAPLNSSAQANYEGGQGAMMFHSAPASKFYNLLGEDYDLVTFPLIGDQPKIGTGVPGYCIYNKTQKRDLAWQFLKYMVSEDGQNAFAKAGATNPPIRKDMADPKTNLWGQGVNGEYKDLNMEAYTYKVEYNQPTDFFLGFAPKKQTELIGNLSDLVTNYLARPGMGLEAALARFDEEIKATINKR